MKFRLVIIAILFFQANSRPIPHGSQSESKSPPRKTMKLDVCYFSEERIDRTIELEPRTRHTAVSTTCGKTLRRMSELATRTSDPNEASRLGYSNDLDLALSRTGNLTAVTSSNFWNGQFICDQHERELITGWESTDFDHIRYNAHHPPEKMCGYNDNSKHRTTPRNFVGKQESNAIMHFEKRLIPIGTKICSTHIRKVNAYGTPLQDPSIHPHRLHSSRVNLKDVFRTEEEETCTSPIPDLPSGDSSYYPTHYDPTEPKMDKTCKQKVQSLLIQAAKLGGIIRLGSNVPYDQLRPHTRRRKDKDMRRAIRFFSRSLDENADEQSVMDSLGYRHDPTWNRHDIRTKFTEIMYAVAARFLQAKSPYERAAALALVAGHQRLHELQEFIPGLGRSVYQTARKMAKSGRLAPKESHRRQKFNEQAIDLFTAFATSSTVMTGLPWGGYAATKSDGSHVWIQNTLRLLTPNEFLSKYEEHLDITGNSHLMLPRSTVYHLLNEVMKATTRMPSQCVDEFAQRGESGWDDLLALLDELNNGHFIDNFEKSKWTNMIWSSRHYLRSDYKSHVRRESSVPDHCAIHALSDKLGTTSNDPFHQACSHAKHNHPDPDCCSRCDMIDTLFAEMRAAVEDVRKDTQDELVFEVMGVAEARIKIAKKKIKALKKHQLRTVYAEMHRAEAVEGLKDGDGLLTIDYAQRRGIHYFLSTIGFRFLPAKHHVSQSEGFGLAGMSWHVSHLMARIGGQLASHTFVDIGGYDKQDSIATTLVLERKMIEMKAAGIKVLTIKSDNAIGTYHNSATLTSLSTIAARVGIRLVAYSFSETQSGKAAADRESARTKYHIHRFLSKQSTASAWTPEEFFKAASSEPGLKGMSFYLHDPITERKGSGAKIDKVSSLFHFEYSSGPTHSIRVFKYHGIGAGTPVKPSKAHALFPVNEGVLKETMRGGKLVAPTVTKWKTDPEKGDFWLLYKKCATCKDKAEEADSNAEKLRAKKDKDEENEDYPENTLFRCPQEGCRAQFILEHNLNRHVDVGKHDFKVERQSLDDAVIDSYEAALRKVDIRAEADPIIVQAIEENRKAKDPTKMKKGVEQGWAQHPPRAEERVPMDHEVKDFLDEMYEKGETDKKWRHAPELTEREMMTQLKADGHRRFLPTQWLSAQTISNYFGRRYHKNREDGDRVKRAAGGEEKANEEEDDLRKMDLNPDKSDYVYEETLTIEDALLEVLYREGVY